MPEPRMRPLSRSLARCLPPLLLAASLAAPAGAGEDALPEPPLSGRAIYARLLANRFAAFEPDARPVAGVRARNEQESRKTVLWKSFRAVDCAPREGGRSKTRRCCQCPDDL